MTTLPCLRCDRLIEVVVSTPVDANEWEEPEFPDEVEIEAKEPESTVTAICGDCLTDSEYVQAARRRTAKLLLGLESVKAHWDRIAARHTAVGDDPEWKREYAGLVASIAQLEAHLAALADEGEAE